MSLTPYNLRHLTPTTTSYKGDIHMADGLNPTDVLSVGFLNDAVQARREIFCQTFDIVLLNDASMQYCVDLLDNLVAKS